MLPRRYDEHGRDASCRVRRWSAFVVILILFGGCSSKSHTSQQGSDSSFQQLAPGDPVREEVLKELTDYYEHFSQRDWQKFSDHFWPGATITTVWQPPGEPAARVVVTSIPDFVKQAPQGPGSKPIFEERMLRGEVRAFGNLAHVWAHYNARFGDPEKVDEWTGFDAFTLMKHDGRWKIVALGFTGE
ncbi:MAG TPA: nuclear transport factor 2 family protein [Blastocatellia bacterium]|nr:nuclear transport factor 2 family protein [Blastocatellia bacterium]